MKTGSITYNGKNSLTDLGIYVTGSGSFDAAELDVDRYEVAGRNGDIIIPKNRYKNISISYPAFIPKGFDGKVQSVRNWLRSAKTYARLEDTYDMNHYRLGLASGIQSFEPANRNDASNFALTFDCKPQRFLKTGETESKVEVDSHSYTGDLVSFDTIAEDDLTTLKSSILPVQSLNGYDHPWAGGAGKNLINTLLSNLKANNTSGTWSDNVYSLNGLTFTVNTDGTIKVNGTATAATYFNFTRYAESISFSAGDYVLHGTGSADINVSVAKNNAYWGAATTANVSLSLDSSSIYSSYSYVANGKQLSNFVLKPMFEKGTTASAFEPYENLCPITGHDSATLYRTGKNLGELSADNLSEVQRATFAYQNGGVVVTAAGTYARGNFHFKTKVGQQYTISFKGKIDSAIFGRVYAGNTTSFDSQYGSIQLTTTEQVFTKTITATKEDLYVSPYLTNGSQSSGVMTIEDFQLELGSSATAYEPYSGDSLAFSFGQTVYGGELDANTGTVTDGWASQDLGALTWSTGFGGFYSTGIKDAVKIPPTSIDSTCLCSAFPTNRTPTQSDNTVMIYPSQNPAYQGWIVIKDARYSDAASFKTAMSGVQLVYELVTPVTLTLSPQTMQTLLGTNNVWSDCGQVTVGYADPFSITNPTEEEARPLFRLVNPQQNDVISLNGKTITISTSYTGEMFIDCETMDAFSSSGTNLNSYITATDFPVLKDGLNIVTFTGSGDIYITPRWWEL